MTVWVPRVLACDVDGTIAIDGVVPNHTADGLRRLIDHGVRVVLATGRPPWRIRAICQVLGLSGPQITLHGALIIDPATGLRLAANSISPHDVGDLLDFSAARSVDVLFSTASRYVTPSVSPGIQRFLRSARPQPDLVYETSDLAVYRTSDVLRAAMLTPAGDPELFRGDVLERFGQRLSVTWGDDKSVDLMAPGVTKGSALATLARHFAVPMSDVAAIGDGRNDLEMLRVAGASVALDSAGPDACAVAGHVVRAGPSGAWQALHWLFPGLLPASAPS